jgi:uncharacterized protein with HEPN domain
MTPLERAERQSRLSHIADACAAVLRFAEDRPRDEYDTDLMLRSAIERQLTIVGEAMVRLREADPEISSQISDVPRIIAFRNRLVHGYDTVDSDQVWAIIQRDLPRLLAEVRALLASP